MSARGKSRVSTIPEEKVAPSKKARQRKKVMLKESVRQKEERMHPQYDAVRVRTALTGSVNFKLGFYNAAVKIDDLA